MKNVFQWQLQLQLLPTMARLSVPVMADDVNITIFNSKMEVQSQFEELAAQYAEKRPALA